MTPTKRAFDLIVALMLLPLLLPLIAGIAALIWARDGAPVFYLSERIREAGRSFQLVKFRTMVPNAARTGVTGGDKSRDITPLGHRLRQLRLDELPQIWNVLTGDLSLVGPRPPLRRYADAAPQLYAEVLRCRPGITGLATLLYHRHEADILERCATPEETHRTYLRRCVPQKARIDRIYASNRSICFDLMILFRTVGAILRTEQVLRGK